MNAAVTALLLAALLICYFEIGRTMIRDKAWSMGSVLLLCLTAVTLMLFETVGS